ncbi:hypothetical protein MOO45_01955 [Bombilactobacillus folatiphilus]|uniref:YtxH domain-containing protein n=1 Tax=Bombilactobacillus folatiphilus TaxID=2923362 RepID=A0ABY4P9X6_9LACO|nr:hypothetical protein [Bombilactobacillus folatiphilus]UQS82472.1 hypothetical protein MOO45_01955 [Bombilactobacillus folatiphilus]
MSKFKFLVGTAAGAGLTYWALEQWQAHKDDIIELLADKFSKLSQIDFNLHQKNFQTETQQLQAALQTENDTTTDFDDIHLDESQIVDTAKK